IHEVIYMPQEAFLDLCDWMCSEGGLKTGDKITIEQQVAIFLEIVGHNSMNRQVQDQFQISGFRVTKYIHIIYYHFNFILVGLVQLAGENIKFPNPGVIAPETQEKTRRRYFNFKDAIGTMDGIQVPTRVPPTDVP
ncbi:hypothetical protein HOY80DRAFT_881907, partial [Tuber brumale]